MPVGAALIKTFAFGEGAERRLIETRVLLHRADGWLALPYLWNEEQTDAQLAIAGARLDVTTPQGEAISYRVPNKNQCKECHGLDDAVVPIGPKARNLSGEWLARWSLRASRYGAAGRRHAAAVGGARQAQSDIRRARLSRRQLRALPPARRDRVEQRARPALGAGRSDTLGIGKRPSPPGAGRAGICSTSCPDRPTSRS